MDVLQSLVSAHQTPLGVEKRSCELDCIGLSSCRSLWYVVLLQYLTGVYRDRSYSTRDKVSKSQVTASMIVHLLSL